jgi:hypothetical protein
MWGQKDTMNVLLKADNKNAKSKCSGCCKVHGDEQNMQQG